MCRQIILQTAKHIQREKVPGICLSLLSVFRLARTEHDVTDEPFTEVRSIELQCGIPMSPPSDVDDFICAEEVIACLPPKDFKVTDQLMKEQNRTDFRDLCIFSIDPPGLA